MTTPRIRSRIPRTQRGMATLTTALVLLIAITLMTFSSARVGLVEQQIAANDYRAKQALQAAQAGLDRAVYASNVGTGVGANGTFTTLVTTLAAVGAGPSTSYQYAYSVPAGATGATLPLITITALGYSDDSAATKTLIQTIKMYQPLPRAPNNPVSAGDRYDSNDALIRIENSISNIAIQAQRDIDEHNKNVTYVGSPLVAGGGKSPGGTIPITGVDGNVGGSAEQEAFFFNAFGASKADIQSISKSVDCSGNCNADLKNSAPPAGSTFGSPPASFIWVTSSGTTKLDLDTVIGSPTQPVVLVVDGTLETKGDVKIYGFIYVTGDAKIEGNTIVQGAVVAERDVEPKDSARITYNQYNIGPNNRFAFDFYVKAPGTWNDLQP